MARHPSRRSRRSSSVEDLADQIRQLQSDLAGLTDTIKAIGAEQMESASGIFNEAVEQAKSSVRVTAEEARERGEAIAEDVESAITRNPFAAILVALGLGFLLAMVIRR